MIAFNPAHTPAADIEQHFYARELTVIDAEDLREIRLESLRHYGEIFRNFYEEEAQKPIEYWIKQCTETQSHCFFGLFHDGELVGVMASRQWEERPGEPIAFWWGNYTRPDFRHLGAAKVLYQKRIEWTKARGFERAFVYVLDGADRPESILQKLGGQKMYSQEMRFAGGPPALWHWYDVPLKSQNQSLTRANGQCQSIK
jgi:GNAT superfamily N-acetyltransferase